MTFQNARQLHELAPRLRVDRLVLETDAPYLAPHPHRGQRNEPAYMPLVANKLAALCRTTVQAIAIQTTATARTCFERPRGMDQSRRSQIGHGGLGAAMRRFAIR